MSNTAGSSIPAGWYRDPAGSDQLRWWDGTAWTAHLAPAPTAVVQPPVVHAPVAPPPVVERPYVPFQNSTQGAEVEFARPVAWNTAGVWLLATSLFWTSILLILGGAIAGAALGTGTLEVAGHLTLTGNIVAGVVYVISWLLLVVAAARDNAALRRLGYLRLTSVLWILLFPPLVYLIIRTVRVRSESGRGAAPLVFYLVSGAAAVVLSITAAIVLVGSLAAGGGLLGASTNAANSKSLAAGITTGLERSGASYSVTCTPFAKPVSQPVNVSCTAIDLGTKVSHRLIIEVEPGNAGGDPTVKLLSVTPPISK